MEGYGSRLTLTSPLIEIVDCVSLLNLCVRSNFNFELSKKNGKIITIAKRQIKIMAPILKPSDLKKAFKIYFTLLFKLIIVSNEILFI